MLSESMRQATTDDDVYYAICLYIYSTVHRSIWICLSASDIHLLGAPGSNVNVIFLPAVACTYLPKNGVLHILLMLSIWVR